MRSFRDAKSDDQSDDLKVVRMCRVWSRLVSRFR